MKLLPCEPPLWALNGHAQTILGHLLPSQRLADKGKRCDLLLSDGDTLVAFVQEGPSPTVVYIFHGLAGSTDSSYIHRTSRLAQALGHTVVIANHRGCGEGLGLARHPYHSGRGEDLSAVIQWGRKTFPNKRHVAVGFSLSGNALLLLASGHRGDVLPDAAISVNAPIHLSDASRLLSRGMNRIYDIKFYLQCRRDVLRGPEADRWKDKIPALASIYRFDDLYTAPAGGFRDREDYYASCSTHQRVQDLQIPTVLITAKDDPFVPVKHYQQAHFSQHAHLHIEEFGGHMGYLTKSKTPRGDNRWQDYAVEEALKFLVPRPRH